jgi:hypothetical protein
VDTVQKRTTYMEIATPAQAPTEPCNIHGEPRARLAREFGSSDLPRAELAVNVSDVTPIALKSPTLIAEKDPYNSVKATVKPEPSPQQPTQTAATQTTDSTTSGSRTTSMSDETSVNPSGSESAPEIRKAIPVAPIRKAIPVQPPAGEPAEIRRAIPVKPLDQENQQRTLLNSAAQSPNGIQE